MKVCASKNMLFITTESKILHFALSKSADKNLKHETDLIIKHNEFLV